MLTFVDGRHVAQSLMGHNSLASVYLKGFSQEELLLFIL